jgi:hypothetical protein
MKDKFANTIREFPEELLLDFSVVDRALSQYKREKWRFFGFYVFIAFVSLTFVIELLSNFVSKDIFGLLSSKYSLLVGFIETIVGYVSKFGGIVVIAFIFMIIFETRNNLKNLKTIF